MFSTSPELADFSYRLAVIHWLTLHTTMESAGKQRAVFMASCRCSLAGLF